MHNEIMKSDNIEKVNEAILTLRHFVDLSARLLPFLYELSNKKSPTENEVEDRNRIIEVYINYSFDTSTSKVLMNSDILEMIQTTFQSILQETNHANRTMIKFIEEHQRLRKNWGYIDAN